MEERSSRLPGGWFWMDNRIVDECGLSAHELAVLAVLCRCRNQVTGKCHPSSAYLSTHTKLSRPSVLKTIKALEGKGLITVTRPGFPGGRRSNEYSLLPVVLGAGPSAPAGIPDLPGPGNPVATSGQGGSHQQDEVNKTQENKKECGEPASPVALTGKQRRKKVKTEESMQRDPNLSHGAVMTYRAISGLTPNRLQRVEIAETVTDVVRWREVIEKWLLAGYRPNNVAGMLDWYHKGIPERSNGNGGHGKSGRSGWEAIKAREQYGSERAVSSDESNRIAAEWDAAPTGGCDESA